MARRMREQVDNNQWLLDALERLESWALDRRLSVLEMNMLEDCGIALGRTSASPEVVEHARERVQQWLVAKYQGRLL